MERFEFQEAAIEKLVSLVKTLWRAPNPLRPITFKAPTGSGKTYMTEKLICELSNQPDWKPDVAYVWITFSDDLAMQSRDKFIEYFGTNLPGQLLTVNDFDKGALENNSVLFVNWQKLVSRNAKDRVLRRPDDPLQRKESGYYFEDVVDLTHQSGREIIMIIDESHRNVTTQSFENVINPLAPKIILNVSATPEIIPNALDIVRGHAGLVEINRQDVIDAGLIKAEISCQPAEDIQKHAGQDLDASLLDLAIEKRKELCKAIDAAGYKVNPLVIIQLPNDDSESKARGDQTKEEYVTNYLTGKGIPTERIAKWFDSEKKPVGLENNESPYDYLLFKMAAGTGWDCPRAQILVMFRQIKTPTFETQTIGRIVRIPVRDKEAYPIFRKGYIFTNFDRASVLNAKYKDPDLKPNIFESKSIFKANHTIDPDLQTEFMSRVDYGDLGKSWAFQKCLRETFNEYFDIKEDDILDTLNNKLSSKGLDLSTSLNQNIIVDTTFKNLDELSLDLKAASETSFEVSKNDVQKIFSSLCIQLLKEQTDEDCKVGNIARSWGALKSALRLWMQFAFSGLSDDERYRIFIKDIKKGADSVFRICITKTLKNYKPLLEQQIEDRKKAAENQETWPFVIKEVYSFSEDYEAYPCNKSVLRPFYLKKEYDGRANEVKFIDFIDKLQNVKWWIKNGDSGKDWFSIRYFNEEENKTALFYPDWIVAFSDGTIGIFDTKAGFTATSRETKNKAESLFKKIQYLNGFNRGTIHYIGGITILENGIWYINNSSLYSYKEHSTNGLKLLKDVMPK